MVLHRRQQMPQGRADAHGLVFGELLERAGKAGADNCNF
jgi:hypothetical protein